MTKIFIDGSAGTTGLRIAERLLSRKDIELIRLSEENRKDINARKEAINQADIVFRSFKEQVRCFLVKFTSAKLKPAKERGSAHRTHYYSVFNLNVSDLPRRK